MIENLAVNVDDYRNDMARIREIIRNFDQTISEKANKS